MLKKRVGVPGISKWLIVAMSFQLSGSLVCAPVALADDLTGSDSKSAGTAIGGRVSALSARFRGFVRHPLTRGVQNNAEALANESIATAPAPSAAEDVVVNDQSSSNESYDTMTPATQSEKPKADSEAAKSEEAKAQAVDTKSADTKSADASSTDAKPADADAKASNNNSGSTSSAAMTDSSKAGESAKTGESTKTTESTDTTATADSAKTEDSSKSDQAKSETSTSTNDATKSEPAKKNTAASVAVIPGEVHTEATKTEDGPMMIDNDQAVETTQTIEYKDLPTDEGGTKVKAGATFPVVVSSQITSKSANTGDPIEARLKYDLKIGDRLVAEQGSTVIGHINYVLKARSAMKSMLSIERWYRNSGCLGITFDEIVNNKGEHIPLVAAPAQQARIVKNKNEGRELGVNHNGQVTGPWSQQLRYKAVRIGLNAAMAPAGAFSFGAMPIALGCIGAANPSFAFMKPVGQNVRHRRIKGFMWGALSGVPGSWIVEDTVVKGQEAIIKPGDEFLAEFKEEFTGEPETEASLIPGASTKVRGQVVPGKKGKKS
ncbi:MAG TPA: hypothetical protein V6C97_15610 [Oculatellaceae cyanobacterium]